MKAAVLHGPHDVRFEERDDPKLFAQVHLLGGPAPVRRYLPQLIDLIWTGEIDPGGRCLISRFRSRR